MNYNHGMGDCDIGPLISHVGADPHELCMEIGLFILYRCMCIGNQGCLQKGVSFSGFARLPLLGAFIITTPNSRISYLLPFRKQATMSFLCTSIPQQLS